MNEFNLKTIAALSSQIMFNITQINWWCNQQKLFIIHKFYTCVILLCNNFFLSLLSIYLCTAPQDLLSLNFPTFIHLESDFFHFAEIFILNRKVLNEWFNGEMWGKEKIQNFYAITLVLYIFFPSSPAENVINAQ